MPNEYIAFVDESEPRQDLLPGSYLLSSVVVDVDAVEAVRDAARPLKRSGATKAHWRDEKTPAGRMELVRAVAAAELMSVVVIRAGAATVPAERRRRLCLERLCYEIEQMGVRDILVESRGPGDRLDRNLIDALRARKSIGPDLRLDHAPGPSEPALWFSDIVCGAVSWDRLGEATYFDVIRDRTILIEI